MTGKSECDHLPAVDIARLTRPAPYASSANTITDNTITAKITAKIEVLTNDIITYDTILDFTALSCIFGSILDLMHQRFVLK